MDRDDEPTDAELLRRSGRDGEAFGRFYDRHVLAVLRFFLVRIDDAQTATDLTAETFAQAFASRRRYRDTGAPARAWLFAIARHQHAHWTRRQVVAAAARARMGVARVELDDVSLERVEQLLDAETLRADLAGALEQLPPGTADAVRLRVHDELPYIEVARRLGCTEGAARVRVARGLDRLAQLLEGTT